MMELVSLLFTCLNILNIVVATPYGYGVQTGAVAAAKADASAGAFGGVGAVPLSIPSGGSFTGSYSKSSSSSFATSSASSSSASFSVSGSGAGSYGHRLNGIPGSTGCATGTCQSGCASGNCQPTENKDVLTLSDNTAGASVIAKNDKEYSGCNGGNCQGNPTNFDCKDGQCSSSLPTNSDLNDIQVKGVGASNYNDKSTNYASGFSGANSGAGAYNKPSTYLAAPKDGSCTSAQCGLENGNIYDTAKPSSYNVPIHGSYGNPPSVEKSPCASGNCGNPSSDSTYVQNPRPEQNGCSSGNCGGNLPSGSYGFNQQKVNTPSESYGYNPQKGCTSGDCGSFSPTQQSPDFSKPSYPKNNSPYGTSGCSTPNCGGNSPQSSQPSYTGFPQPAPSQSNIGVFVGANAVGQTSIAGSTAEKVPYKGGFGGPSGLLKPNDFSVSVSLNAKPGSIATTVLSPTPCSSGNCGPKPQYEFPNKLNEPAPVGRPTEPYNPSSCLSGKCSNPGSTLSNNSNPSFSGGTYVHVTGFGGPSGILKPNDHVVSSVLPLNYVPTPIHKPSPSSYPCLSGTCGSSLSPSSPPAAHKQTSPTGPSFNIPNPSGNYYSAAEPTHAIPQYKPSEINSSPCTSGNCNSNQPQSTYTHSFSTPSCPLGNCESFSANSDNCKNGKCGTPTSQVSPLSTLPFNNSPCSTGNCGFSSGQSFPQSGPHNSYNPTGCTFGNCATAQNPNYSHNSGAHAAAGAAAASSSKAVVYTGGFGGPPGLLKPYDDGKLKHIPNWNIPPYNPGVPTAGSSYGKSINLSGGLVSSGKALGLAAAGAASGAFGGSTYPSGYTKSGGGCNSGCGGQNKGSGLGLNSGFSEGAAAKSAAIAGAGAGSYGGAGSFASSSASAYASAGASAKGGYGRR